LVSVVVPVFNTRPYLEECLESLVAQTLRDVEIICVDNGSTDGSFDVLEAYAGRHANVVALKHAQGRQGAARNYGIERARGRYIGFVDSDDHVSPAMFEKMHAAAAGCGADVVVCNIESRYEGQEPSGPMLPEEWLAGGAADSIQERPNLLRNMTICNKMISRDLLERHGIRFPSGLYHEDQFFVISAFVFATRIATVPDTLYFYRKGRPGSVSASRGEDALDVFEVMRAVAEMADGNKIGGPIRSLLEEVRALKYLQLYEAAGGGAKGVYYRNMRRELQTAELPWPPRVLSLPEWRQAQVAKRGGRLLFDLYLSVRDVYGRARGCLRNAGASRC
jgi:glycosyltransferase involved in cell wall biosynthesis